MELEQKLVAAVEQLVGLSPAESTSKSTKDYYTTEDLVRQFGRKRETYERALREGKLQGIKVAGRGRSGEWRVSKEEVTRWQDKGYLIPRTGDRP